MGTKRISPSQLTDLHLTQSLCDFNAAAGDRRSNQSFDYCCVAAGAYVLKGLVFPSNHPERDRKHADHSNNRSVFMNRGITVADRLERIE